MVNRKLIRPSLADIKEQMPKGNNANTPRKRIPPEQTNAENYYYIKQMASRTPMVLKLLDGEEVRGAIEWYDKNCIKVHRDKGPNLLIFKHTIRYMYKDNEAKTNGARHEKEEEEIELEEEP